VPTLAAAATARWCEIWIRTSGSVPACDRRERSRRSTVGAAADAATSDSAPGSGGSYADRFGLEELVPVEGPPLSDDEAGALARLPFPPAGFDDVPAALRPLARGP